MVGFQCNFSRSARSSSCFFISSFLLLSHSILSRKSRSFRKKTPSIGLLSGEDGQPSRNCMYSTILNFIFYILLLYLVLRVKHANHEAKMFGLSLILSSLMELLPSLPISTLGLWQCMHGFIDIENIQFRIHVLEGCPCKAGRTCCDNFPLKPSWIMRVILRPNHPKLISTRDVAGLFLQ